MITYLAMIVPTLIVGVYASWQSWTYGSLQIHANLDITTERIKDQIQGDFEKYNNLFSLVLYDVRISQAIRNGDGFRPGSNISSYMSLLNSIDVKLGKFKVYLARDIPDNNFFHSNETVKSEEWYSLAVSSTDAIVYPAEHALIVAEKLPDIFSNDNLSVLRAEISYSTLFYELNNRGTHQSNIIIFDSRAGKILLQNTLDEENALSIETIKKLPYTGENEFVEKKRKFILSTKYIPSTKWTVAAYLPERVVAIGTMKILFTTGLFAVLGLGFALAMIVLLNRWIIVPIRHLNDEMKKVQKADFSVKVDYSSDDEIGQLSKQFSAMAGYLDTLIADAYTSKIAMNEAEMKALQAQVNPHFLYNCLSAINMEALKIDAVTIHKMVVSLAQFYRTVVTSGDELILLSDEIENIRAYLDIQMLLSDRVIDIEYRIEDRVMDLYLPNLTMQPIVENAIEHGVEKIEEDGKIIIGAAVRDELLEIWIEDNGPGASAATLESILQQSSRKHGMQNVNKRIQLQFGAEFGIAFRNPEPTGLTTIIRLPIITQSTWVP
jgi:two-component system, sensor histidine kinase YesM